MSEEEQEKEKEQEENNFQEIVCEKCPEYLSGWKRALADYDNIKKELSTARISIYQSAIEQVADQLIPVLDNFDQALKFKPEGLDKTTESWLQGILHVRTQMENILKDMGLEPFGVIGENFDPHQHEASSEQQIENSPSGIILDVLQRGWRRNKFIVRPAKVIVSA